MEKTRERDSEREICATLPLGDKWVADVELAIVGSLCETCVRVGEGRIRLCHAFFPTAVISFADIASKSAFLNQSLL